MSVVVLMAIAGVDRRWTRHRVRGGEVRRELLEPVFGADHDAQLIRQRLRYVFTIDGVGFLQSRRYAWFICLSDLQ